MRVRSQRGLHGRAKTPYSVLMPIWVYSYKIVIWVGVNDCGMGLNAIRQLSVLFALHDRLCAVGARNFVYFNVPPTDRSPAGILAFSII